MSKKKMFVDFNRCSLYELAMHDMAFQNFDMKFNIKDVAGDKHQIFVSRLRVNGIIVDINRTTKMVHVYDLLKLIADGLDGLPLYLKEVIWQADEYQKTRYGF